MWVNAHLTEMCKERKLNLINYSKKIKPNHLNRGKLHLLQKGSKVLGDAFLKKISAAFNWHYSDEDSRLYHKACKSKFSLDDKKMIDAKTILWSTHQENTNKLSFAHINIKSLRNKFELLVDQVKGNINVLMIYETKIDDSFPLGNFLIGSFSKPYRLDRDSLDGGIALYVREDIPTNLTEVKTKPIEDFYVKINLRNDKWLINCWYNPHKNVIGNHLLAISEKLDLYSTSYDNFIILDDFNIEMEEQQIKDFCDNYSLKSLIRQPTCYKNPSNPTWIDLILTNAPQKFQRDRTVWFPFNDSDRYEKDFQEIET